MEKSEKYTDFEKMKTGSKLTVSGSAKSSELHENFENFITSLRKLPVKIGNISKE